MRTWAINLTEAPWWVLVLVAIGSLVELRHQQAATIDPLDCANACFPYGIASYSTTSCTCRGPE